MNSSGNKPNPEARASVADPVRTSAESSDIEATLERIDVGWHRMGRLMTSRVSALCRDDDLTPPTYMVLKTISSGEAARVSDVAAMLGVKAPAASMLVQHLEAAGLIERAHDSEDQRVVRLSLTESGRERLASAEETRRRFMREITADLDAQDLNELARILEILAATVARME